MTTIWNKRSVFIIKFFPSRATRETPIKDDWLLKTNNKIREKTYQTYGVVSDVAGFSLIDDTMKLCICSEHDFKADSTALTNCSIVLS